MFADMLRRLRGIILWTPALALAACGSTQARPQLQPAPVAPVVAKVAIPVACVIERVPMPAYPGDLIEDGDDVYTLARLSMADRHEPNGSALILAKLRAEDLTAFQTTSKTF